MQYLPSKKFLVVVLAALIVLGAWFLASYKSNSNNDNNSSGKFSYISSLFKSNDKDSDNDGLMDWEEALWKTDPKNPDTDGDGTLDGEEVNQGRDPLKAGPDDEIKRENLFTGTGPIFNSQEEVLTKTDIMARSFLSSFMLLYRSGNLNEQTKEQMTKTFLGEIEKETLKDKYKLLDLDILYDSSTQSLKNYGNEIAKAVDRNNFVSEQNEIMIINQAFSKENEEELQKLNPIINLYRNLANDCLAIKVPQDISRHHLDLVNNINNISLALINIKEIFNDPIKGFVGINQYQKEYLEIQQVLLDISKYFTEKNILFDNTEYGYDF
ncbi:thrombospondin type 3 repeat-containing protein, partial [Patescibacteria group bacterium]|nr:thrombospondin type 3 repeat-containing protein [Patescibacteria group bacterium]